MKIESLTNELRTECSVYDKDLCDRAANMIEGLYVIVSATISALEDELPRTSQHIRAELMNLQYPKDPPDVEIN